MSYINHDGEEVQGFKTPYNHNTEAEAARYATQFPEPTITQQSGKDEADINEIVRRFGLTGQLPQIQMPPLLEDFDQVFDFKTAMNTIAAAKHSFMQLDAKIRNRFENDPAQFVAYVDEAVATGELDELRKWGLAVPKPPQEPPKAPEGTPLGDPAPKT